MGLLSAKQTAIRTEASESFWRKQILLKTIPVVRVGRLVRIDERDLEAWLAARRSPESVPAENRRASKQNRPGYRAMRDF
jgi:excisionase family DNA binding protein